MPQAGSGLSTGAFALWLGGIAVASFLVSWVFADVLHLRRTPYIGVLAAATAALTVSYLAWSGTTGFVLAHWWWGLAGAVVSGAVAIALLRRVPMWRVERGPFRIGRFLWEGVVYGTAEGVLLSVLPVLVTWQALDARGWTDTTGGTIGVGALALVASLFVVAVHHLGYRAFRGRQLIFALLGCVWFTVAYLLTASPFAAAGGHIAMHEAASLHGIELPPHETHAQLAIVRPEGSERRVAA